MASPPPEVLMTPATALWSDVRYRSTLPLSVDGSMPLVTRLTSAATNASIGTLIDPSRGRTWLTLGWLPVGCVDPPAVIEKLSYVTVIGLAAPLLFCITPAREALLKKLVLFVPESVKLLPSVVKLPPLTAYAAETFPV